MTDDRVAWLTARLDEVERVAQDAKGAGLDRDFPFWIDVDTQHDYDAAEAFRAAFPPSAALARVEADRRILAQHQAKSILTYGGPPANVFTPMSACRLCGKDPNTRTGYPCETVLALLSAHRYAPGFREEWLSV